MTPDNDQAALEAPGWAPGAGRAGQPALGPEKKDSGRHPVEGATPAARRKVLVPVDIGSGQVQCYEAVERDKCPRCYADLYDPNNSDHGPHTVEACEEAVRWLASLDDRPGRARTFGPDAPDVMGIGF